MKNIDYKKLKRYDLGKMQTSTGYQANARPNISSFQSTPSTDISGSVSDLRLQTALQGINKAAQIGTTIPSIFQGAQNVIPKLGMTEVDAVEKYGEGGVALMLGKKAGEGVGSTSKVLSAAGKAAGVAGAAMGAYNIVNDAMGFNDNITGSQMMDMSSKNTQTKNGVSYTTYGGFNENSIRDYTSAQNTAGTLGLSLDGASTGASIGSLIAPGIGTVLGGVIGGLGGLVGGLFGGDSRRRRVEREIRDTKTAMANYNTQAESDAGSQGLRNRFYATHADKGKDITYDKGKPGQIGMVHTSHGVVPGIMRGLAGKGESIYNPTDGTASVFKEGRKRVDNIPTGTPLNKFDKGREWDNTIIFGNMINPMTGNSFADDAKPYSKTLEKLDKEDNMTSLSKHTKEINRKNAMNKLNQLASVLSDVRRFNCGKTGKFDAGWGDYASMLLPHFGLMGAVLASKHNYTPAYRESYVDDNTSSDLNQLQSLRFDPTQALGNINTATRGARYNTMQSGGLSAGQRAALVANNELAGAKAKNDILSQYGEKNIGLKQSALQAAIAAKQANAQRMQQSREQAFARNDRAQAIDDNFRQQYYANLASQFGSIGKDFMAMNQYNQAQDYQNKLINLYNEQQKLDRDRFNFERNLYRNNNTPVASVTQQLSKQVDPSNFDFNNVKMSPIIFPSVYTQPKFSIIDPYKIM